MVSISSDARALIFRNTISKEATEHRELSKKQSFKWKLTELQVLCTSTHWELVNPSSTPFQLNTSHKEMQDLYLPLSSPACKSIARAVCMISQSVSNISDLLMLRWRLLTWQAGSGTSNSSPLFQGWVWGWCSSGLHRCSKQGFCPELHHNVRNVQLHLGKLHLITHHSYTRLESNSFISRLLFRHRLQAV